MCSATLPADKQVGDRTRWRTKWQQRLDTNTLVARREAIKLQCFGKRQGEECQLLRDVLEAAGAQRAVTAAAMRLCVAVLRDAALPDTRAEAEDARRVLRARADVAVRTSRRICDALVDRQCVACAQAYDLVDETVRLHALTVDMCAAASPTMLEDVWALGVGSGLL